MHTNNNMSTDTSCTVTDLMKHIRDKSLWMWVLQLKFATRNSEIPTSKYN